MIDARTIWFCIPSPDWWRVIGSRRHADGRYEAVEWNIPVRLWAMAKDPDAFLRAELTKAARRLP